MQLVDWKDDEEKNWSNHRAYTNGLVYAICLNLSFKDVERNLNWENKNLGLEVKREYIIIKEKQWNLYPNKGTVCN